MKKLIFCIIGQNWRRGWSCLSIFLWVLWSLGGSRDVDAQNLPSEWWWSADGRTLHTGGKADPGFYHPDSIRRVDLSFPQANYWTLLGQNYASETNLLATLSVGNQVLDSVGVRFRGNTSYTTIGSSQKKSFGIETDWLRPNQDLMGFRNLKFNNAHGDATFMREVLYNQTARRYTPIAKGNFVRLFLNGQDWGLYCNVQDVDKDFLEEWFLSNDGPRFRATTGVSGGGGGPGGGWGDGTAGMNFLGVDTNLYKTYYSLKSSDIPYTWEALVKACQVLSQVPGAPQDSTRRYLDIDRILWYLAVENVFADDDSYVMKGKMDYMVYYEPETGRVFPFEYDGNSSFLSTAATSASWTPFKNVTSVNYPLLNKLLNVPEWRQRYLAHYRTILAETFNPTRLHPMIDTMNARIASLVAADTKKLTTTAAYTSGVPSLKTFVTNRYNYLSNNVEVAQQGSVILGMDQYDSSGRWNVAPLPGQVVRIRVKVANAAQTASVRLYHAEGWVGNFQRMDMWDDGLHFDSLPGDGLYGAVLPGHAAMTVVRYYAEAVANNTAQSLTYFPAGAEHDVMVYRVQGGALRNGLVINEFMAMNQGGPVDDIGENDDWIELHNVSNQAVNAGRYVLTDNPLNTTKWKFPRNTVVPAGGYLIVWADEDSSQGPYHANFKLSGLGETLYLYDSNTVLQDEVIYPNQVPDSSWARIPNGSGPFARRAHTIAANNNFALNVPNNLWRKLDFRLYPNPGDKQVHWEISGIHENNGSGPGGEDANSSFDAEMVNAAGQVLWKSSGALPQQTDASNPGGVVDVSDWPQGAYWFRMRSGNRVYLRTWIKR